MNFSRCYRRAFDPNIMIYNFIENEVICSLNKDKVGGGFSQLEDVNGCEFASNEFQSNQEKLYRSYRPRGIDIDIIKKKGNCLYYNDREGILYKYDIQNDTVERIAKSINFFEDGFRIFSEDDAVDGICDYDGNMIVNLLDYDTNSSAYIDNHVIAICKGKGSGLYLCCINSDGKTEFEPIKIAEEKEFAAPEIEDWYAMKDRICYRLKGYDYYEYTVMDFSGNIIPIEGKLLDYNPETGISVYKVDSERIVYYNAQNEPFLILNKR